MKLPRRIVRKFPNAKVIIVTNYDENDLRQITKDAGAIGYIVKNNLMELNSFLIAAQNFADAQVTILHPRKEGAIIERFQEKFQEGNLRLHIFIFSANHQQNSTDCPRQCADKNC